MREQLNKMAVEEYDKDKPNEPIYFVCDSRGRWNSGASIRVVQDDLDFQAAGRG